MYLNAVKFCLAARVQSVENASFGVIDHSTYFYSKLTAYWKR